MLALLAVVIGRFKFPLVCYYDDNSLDSYLTPYLTPLCTSSFSIV